MANIHKLNYRLDSPESEPLVFGSRRKFGAQFVDLIGGDNDEGQDRRKAGHRSHHHAVRRRLSTVG